MVGVRSVFVGSLSFLIAVGCGSAVESDFDGLQSSTEPTGSSSGFDGKGDANVQVDPKNATVIIDVAATPPSVGSVVYRVMRGAEDVTASAQFTVQDPSLGNFSGATFTSVAALPAGVLGKSTMVTAKTERGEAFGTLTVVQLRKTGKQRDFFFVVPYLCCLDDHGVRFVVLGGHVLATLGRPRYTDDLDVLVEPTKANGARLAEAFRTFGYPELANQTKAHFSEPERMATLGKPPSPSTS